MKMNNAEQMQTTVEKAPQTAVHIFFPHLHASSDTAKGIFELFTFNLDGDRNIGLLQLTERLAHRPIISDPFTIAL